MPRNILTMSRRDLNSVREFLSPTALIQMVDPEVPYSPPPPGTATHLRLCFHDWNGGNYNGLVPPDMEHAKSIKEFLKRIPDEMDLAIQCEAGVGRSRAVLAAITGDRRVIREGGYNTLLYRQLMIVLDKPMPKTPLVAVVVRKKYPDDRIRAFILSLQRQRFTNWKCIIVGDFNPETEPEDFYFLLETEGGKLWGHPYRQKGIDFALKEIKPDYITLQNDDNYLTPGFLEQMVWEAEDNKSPLVMCHYLNSYMSYASQPVAPKVGCCDLCCFLAKASLVAQVPWPGDDFEADGRFIESLNKLSGRCRIIERPLVVKN